ncbi:MAG: hypothetical protein VKJ27_11970 [Synechocystis sp.]|nr:hypothetical protein [Synechocystis sp.]
MSPTRNSFHILKECYQWAWVLNHGTAFFETTTYEHPHFFHYLHRQPRSSSAAIFPAAQQPAIALPPETFLELICGSEQRPPMLQKIKQLASAFEEFLSGFPTVRNLAIEDLVLFHDRERDAIGVISHQEFLSLHPH